MLHDYSDLLTAAADESDDDDQQAAHNLTQIQPQEETSSNLDDFDFPEITPQEVAALVDQSQPQLQFDTSKMKKTLDLPKPSKSQQTGPELDWKSILASIPPVPSPDEIESLAQEKLRLKREKEKEKEEDSKKTAQTTTSKSRKKPTPTFEIKNKRENADLDEWASTLSLSQIAQMLNEDFSTPVLDLNEYSRPSEP